MTKEQTAELNLLIATLGALTNNYTT